MVEKQTITTGKTSTVYSMTVMALMTAVTCIIAPMSIPIGPVPISLTNLVLCFSIVLVGKKKGDCQLFHLFVSGSHWYSCFFWVFRGDWENDRTNGWIFDRIFIPHMDRGYIYRKASWKTILVCSRYVTWNG